MHEFGRKLERRLGWTERLRFNPGWNLFDSPDCGFRHYPTFDNRNADRGLRACDLWKRSQNGLYSIFRPTRGTPAMGAERKPGIGEGQGMTAKVTVEDVERVAELNELKTAEVAPLAQVSELETAGSASVLRADLPLPSLDRAAVMLQAPETDQVFFKVPKVIVR